MSAAGVDQRGGGVSQSAPESRSTNVQSSDAKCTSTPLQSQSGDSMRGFAGVTGRGGNPEENKRIREKAHAD